MFIENLEFVETCGACPEQYDVYFRGTQVGYVRLRWGGLRCDFPDVNGETIYAYAYCDGYRGCFEDDEDRELHLTKIANAIWDRILNGALLPAGGH